MLVELDTAVLIVLIEIFSRQVTRWETDLHVHVHYWQKTTL